MSRIRSFVLLVMSTWMAVAGCTKERAPRSYVQPNALRKADLEGTWYYVQTVLDAPPSATSAFVGLSTDLLKVKFDIQEDMLYARRAYEQITGAEDSRSKDPSGYLGQPLAAWKISKHFDIIRDYNATTGEETNKIIESEERAWSQREFFRVDWSKNLADKYDGLFFFDQVKIAATSYWESDPGKPEAIHLERAAKGDPEFTAGEANYLDLTNKLVLSPAERTLCFSDGQCMTIPACFLQYQLEECTDSVLKVRHSFAKISPKHDYQPRNWDGKQMELFGLWDVGLNRFSYNREYGVTNSGISRHAARFNLWKKSYGPDGKPIPYAQRELRTIPYYADTSAATYPEDLFAASQKVIDQWNDAVGVAVADVRGRPTTERVFVFCHNPVKLLADAKGPADHAACKEGLLPDLDAKGQPVLDAAKQMVYHARQGDPRRSRIFWVNQMQMGGPLGYGPPMFDAETGETISGQAYIYGAALDTYASRGRDLVLLTTGKLATDDFISGVNVKEWVAKNREGKSLVPETLTNEDVNKRIGAMDFSWARGLAPEVKVDLSSQASFRQTFRDRQNALFSTGIFGHGQADLGVVRRDRARGSAIEALMITPDILTMATGSPLGQSWAALSDSQKARVSPLRVKDVDTFMQERNRRLMALGFDFADFADDGVAQRALRIVQEGGADALDPDKLWHNLRQDIFTAVTLHEVGHNVGLRHNFRASYDSLNYHPKYWELRTAGMASTKRFAGLNPTTGQAIGVPYQGTDCSRRMRPRYIDCPGGALSVEEAMGGVQEYQYSSVMDYGSDFNSDIMGLGHYDKAAMKFAYAGDGYVEVFTKPKTTNTALAKLASLQYFSASYGFPSPINLGSSALQGIAYHTYPSLFTAGAADIEARQDVPYADIEALNANFPLLVDKNSKASTTDLKPMVPYYFCGDEFVGNLTCQRFDAGADAYEQAHDLISRYENYYILNNFKRDRYSFYTSASYRSTILGRYLQPLRQQMTWYTLFQSIFGDIGDSATLFGNEDGWANFGVAVTQGFDLLGRIITEPEAGSFELVSASRSPTPYDHYQHVSDQLSLNDPARINVSLLDGKYSTTTWDFDGCGYYWSDECQSRIGYFLDKTFAIETLTDSQANFTGRDTSTDVRLYAIGYILPFRKQLMEKFGAILAGDYRSLAPGLRTTGLGLEKPSWTLADGSVTRDKLLDPAAGFTLQLYAGVYGLAGFPSTFDQSFVDATRIFVVGNGEAPIPDSQLLAGSGVAGPQATFVPSELVSATPPGTKNWFVWTDQATGKTYAARAFAREAGGDAGSTGSRIDAGARMLEMALILETQTAAACGAKTDAVSCQVKTRALANYRQNLDIMRSLHNAFGYGRFTTDAPFYY